jgi:hypothetical protein
MDAAFFSSAGLSAAAPFPSFLASDFFSIIIRLFSQK